MLNEDDNGSQDGQRDGIVYDTGSDGDRSNDIASDPVNDIRQEIGARRRSSMPHTTTIKEESGERVEKRADTNVQGAGTSDYGAGTNTSDTAANGKRRRAREAGTAGEQHGQSSRSDHPSTQHDDDTSVATDITVLGNHSNITGSGLPGESVPRQLPPSTIQGSASNQNAQNTTRIRHMHHFDESDSRPNDSSDGYGYGNGPGNPHNGGRDRSSHAYNGSRDRSDHAYNGATHGEHEQAGPAYVDQTSMYNGCMYVCMSASVYVSIYMCKCIIVNFFNSNYIIN